MARGRDRGRCGAGRRHGAAGTRGFSLATAMASIDLGACKISADEMQSRRAELDRHLRAMGGQLRDDSRHAFNYITGADTSGLSAQETAADMVAVQYLHANTGYAKRVEADMRKVAEWAHREYPSLHWGDVWRITRDAVPLCCQLETFREQGGLEALCAGA